MDMAHEQLSENDIAVLIEALEAWENKDGAGEILGDMMDAMFAKQDPVAIEAMKREREQARVKRERERSARKEQSVLLRAKLLTIRNERGVRMIEQAVNR